MLHVQEEKNDHIQSGCVSEPSLIDMKDFPKQDTCHARVRAMLPAYLTYTKYADSAAAPDRRRKPVTAVDARESLGLTLEEAANRLRICSPYLRRVERSGGASWILCRRLSQLYQVPIDIFIFSKGGGGEKRPRSEASARNRQFTQIRKPKSSG